MPAIVIDTPAMLKLFTMRAQLGACKLELVGLKHRSGRSIIKFVKETYRLKAKAKASIVEEFKAYIDAFIKEQQQISAAAEQRN